MPNHPRKETEETIVLIMRNHSGIPYVHYVIGLSDPELPEKMKYCGISGTVEDVKSAIENDKSYNPHGSGYWISKGDKDSEADY